MGATAPVAPAAVPRPSQQPDVARAPAAAAPQASGVVTCPQCGHGNVGGNRFCASCGYNLSALSGAQAVPSGGAPVAGAAPGGAKPIVLTALRADGTEAGTFRLPDGPSVTVGRDTGSIFAGDSYLSPRHATFTRRGPQLSIRDESSLNGVYLKLKPREPNQLEYGDVFRIGQEIIRFEELRGQGPTPDGVERFGSPAKGYIGRLALVIGRDTTGNAFPIPERGVHCGRERGDILFSEDGYVSGLHCQVARGADGKIYLTDLGSSNGSFIRLRAERGVGGGDILLMGQQLFRVDL
jgi:pSer/pThr/pTyr-binding forkhead associated (FHA) protein